MDYRTALEFVSLFPAGLLAGAEILVRLGVRDPLRVLADVPHLQLRQALIRQLRVLVPVLFGSTVVSSIAVAVVLGAGPGAGFRWAGLAAVLAWTLVTFLGTVPINKAALDWQPDAPPANWRTLIRRWERLDTARALAATLAFAAFLAAAAQSPF
jgi:Domain of unknown function (DUF1772)